MWPAAAAALGPLGTPASTAGGPPEARQWPGSQLTLDGPIESRYQYFTKQYLGAFGTLIDASIAAPNAPGRWTLDRLGPFPFLVFFTSTPDRTK